MVHIESWNRLGETMAADRNQSSKKEGSLIPGASIFLSLVVYFNIRSDHVMTVVDWGAIVIGVLFFTIAMFRRFQSRG